MQVFFAENKPYWATFLELCSKQGASSQPTKKENKERWFKITINAFLCPSTIKKKKTLKILKRSRYLVHKVLNGC